MAVHYPDGSIGGPGGGSDEDGFRTVVEAHEEFATWLVGSRGPLGGAGGESEAFEQDVVQRMPAVESAARGVDTALQEGNWFRRASVAQMSAMTAFLTDTRQGMSALGNAAGYSGDTYDEADRASHNTFEDPDEQIARARTRLR